ncbi:hypothetical protein BCI9360_02006 [Bacillus sp. CECT 9360]|nr:hypothetical protein BCI9360_02006 [Bacillus sp. CECT 9360]
MERQNKNEKLRIHVIMGSFFSLGFVPYYC